VSRCASATGHERRRTEASSRGGVRPGEPGCGSREVAVSGSPREDVEVSERATHIRSCFCNSAATAAIASGDRFLSLPG
jgi:hypothetical protein